MAEEVKVGENHGCASVSSELFSGVGVFRFNCMLATSLDAAVSRSESSVFGVEADGVAGLERRNARGSAEG